MNGVHFLCKWSKFKEEKNLNLNYLIRFSSKQRIKPTQSFCIKWMEQSVEEKMFKEKCQSQMSIHVRNNKLKSIVNGQQIRFLISCKIYLRLSAWNVLNEQLASWCSANSLPFILWNVVFFLSIGNTFSPVCFTPSKCGSSKGFSGVFAVTLKNMTEVPSWQSYHDDTVTCLPLR